MLTTTTRDELCLFLTATADDGLVYLGSDFHTQSYVFFLSRLQVDPTEGIVCIFLSQLRPWTQYNYMRELRVAVNQVRVTVLHNTPAVMLCPAQILCATTFLGT